VVTGFDEMVVERLAVAGYDSIPHDNDMPWEYRSEYKRDTYRTVATAVVAAFVADDPVRQAAREVVEYPTVQECLGWNPWWPEFVKRQDVLRAAYRALAATEDATHPVS